MRKKTLVKKVYALALTFAMVTGPVSYARAEEPSPQNAEETVGTEAFEMNGVVPEGTEGLGAAAPTDGVEQPEQAGAPAGGELAVQPEKTEETQKPEEQEKPMAPGQTGTPGWLLQGNDWYYYDASGAKAAGWRVIGGAWYYFDGENAEKPGIMLADGKYPIGNHNYFFDAAGKMQSGWILRPEGWYYTAGSGAMLTGWQVIGGNWYYLDSTDPEYPGRMAENCKKVIGDSTYFFALGGAMRTGWIKQEEGWYYTDASGSVGWKNIGGAWYYLDGSGVMYAGRWTPDGRYVDYNGVWVQ